MDYKWISTDDELPLKNEEVLIKDIDGEYKVMARLEFTDNYFGDWIGDCNCLKKSLPVKYWMRFKRIGN